MPIFEELTESVFPGAMIGIGAAFLAPVIVTPIGSLLKPIVKTVVRTGLYVGDKLYEAASEAGEQISDIVAEARAEMTHPATAGSSGRVARKK